jgi:pimeloyl-ACP methyl ester carboxylesterase
MEDAAVLFERLATRHHIAFDRGRVAQSKRVAQGEGPTLHVLDWSGPGDPVIFLHGGALSAHTWDLVCLDLSDRFHCVALDLRGHGESEWADDYTIEANVADVAAVTRCYGWQRAHIVGMSLGGACAAHYAAAYPQSVASLTAVDVGPHVNFVASSKMRAFLDEPLTGRTFASLVDAALAISKHPDRDKFEYRYRYLVRYDESAGLEWRQDRRKPRDFAHILAKLDELGELAAGASYPALTVIGENSGVLGVDRAANYARRFARGTWISIPGAGHNVQEDNPKALAQALRTFFDTT